MAGYEGSNSRPGAPRRTQLDHLNPATAISADRRASQAPTFHSNQQAAAAQALLQGSRVNQPYFNLEAPKYFDMTMSLPGGLPSPGFDQSLQAGSSASGRSGGPLDPHSLDYTSPDVDLDTVKTRQLNEDITAYNYDLEYCKSTLTQPNLTPQEARTLQLRTLDLGHQIRNAKHQLELLQLAQRSRAAAALGSSGLNSSNANFGNNKLSSVPSSGPGTGMAMKHASSRQFENTSAPSQLAGRKREGPEDANSSQAIISNKRVKAASPSDDSGNSGVVVGGSGEGGEYAEGQLVTALQRLGHWRCRLCESRKYELAGSGRKPAAPVTWPLKDMAKLMAHYLDMHTEHEPDERCRELGDALYMNRGPFEYWLRKTRGQKLPDGSIIDNIIGELRAGRVPFKLKELNRAAAAFPGN